MPDEAHVIEFVRSNTTIPVPQVMDIVRVPYSQNKQRSWLMITTTLPGSPLFINGKGHRLLHASETHVDHIKVVLADWVNQLRALRSPYGKRVSGFLGGPFLSYRIGYSFTGPYDTTAHFHSQPFCTVYPPQLAVASTHALRLIEDRPNKVYEIRLTHGDLLLHNILADDDFRPTGLIDWECAGWMPEYWETASSSRNQFGRMWCWKDILHDAFPKYEDDLTLEYHIQMGYDSN
ncbi:hypothetical protein C0989_005597 [Termitomyces sp. Mn162]|nr:hypothetical protein C0989_005597 [Termitomyces sp. Mn162]KAH0582214.1 hypothetical protein H2248_011862 [Termitomyces sp. 'cryptogamus']